MLGDGCIYLWNKTYIVWLHGEREFCEKYARKVPSCTSKTKATAYEYRGKNVWFVRFDNAELFLLIKRIRENLETLSNLIRRGDQSANSLQLIEGFFDAEGWVKVIKESVRKTPKISIDFCNTNLGLLQLIGHELKTTLGIEPHFSQPADPTRKTILASANLQKERNQKIPFTRSDDKTQN